ncbi:hypothetical protein PVAP13_6KG097335 [Panicum virgatum]|uniref:Uncharacterized protein n=1 Tax=Panicum virgatum TaxID=38727 RepID=A0A8T0RAU7_PANVG|nr:hypothetical protein PVAP13_6KG097335 [Panicum virgatum]
MESIRVGASSTIVVAFLLRPDVECCTYICLKLR